MTAKRETIRLLKRQIESRMVLSESLRPFFPESDLRVMFTLDDIEKAVEELNCLDIEKTGLAQTIHDKGTRMFAILIKNGEEDLIAKFRKHEVLDAQLPLSNALAEQIAGDFGISFAREYQRQFLPYKFPQNMRDYHRHINDEWILPFVGKPEDVVSGSFADISKVTIFHSQQEFVRDKSSLIQVIRKEIRRSKGQTKEAYYEDFRNEQRCLFLLDRLEHPNIIPLLGSYTYGERHNFLFPAYEKDLWDFLRSDDRFEDFRWRFTFFSALRGLASALCSTHKLHLKKEKHGLDINAIGYHHDLRPANVLVSQETFILADFGLGKFKPKDVPSQTPWKTGHGDYLAPECMDEKFVHQNVGRAIDVWAFGCLLVEVIIYMERGTASLKEFRELRTSPGRSKRWKENYFFDKDGRLKSVVLQWLDSLTNGLLHPGPVSLLADVSRKALKGEPSDRPKIEDICADLTLISLKEHLITVRNLFYQYMEQYTATPMEQTSAGMKLWFARERLAAFGYVTGLDNDTMNILSSGNLNSRYEEYLKILKAMAVCFHEIESESPTEDSNAIREPEVVTENCDHFNRRSEHKICELVESLWNLLPLKERREAETTWLRDMLDTKDIRRLDNIERAFKTEDDPTYEKGAAMAMMKKIGLYMKSNPTHMLEDFIVSENDIQRRVLQLRHHEFGLFKGEHVLIESIYYSPGWEKVSPDQRATTMSCKAEGFSEKARSASTRTLGCIGAFENTNRQAGYGFLYRIPISNSKVDIGSSTATLLQLVENKMCLPLLGNKFRLASVLAQFLGDFHNAGWLHENVNSNNILFFNVVNSERNSSHVLHTQVLEQPYVVGLHKSRLGGNFWQTEGPASRGDFQEYQHPEYNSTGRYRAAYDYYSLGLVLLEVGFWKPLHAWKESQKCSRMKWTEFRQELLETWVPLVGTHVGAVYRDAIRFCLSQTDRSQDLDKAALDDFAKNVIEPLKELAEAPV